MVKPSSKLNNRVDPSPMVKKSKLKLLRGDMSERGTMSTRSRRHHKASSDYYLNSSASVGRLADVSERATRSNRIIATNNVSDSTSTARSSSSRRKELSSMSSERSSSKRRSKKNVSSATGSASSSSSRRLHQKEHSSSRGISGDRSTRSSRSNRQIDSTDDNMSERKLKSSRSRRRNSTKLDDHSETSCTSLSASARSFKNNSSCSLCTTDNKTSVLIIGATGRTGLSCCGRFARHESKPEIHLFCQNKSKVPHYIKRDSIFEGDATNEDDLSNALRKSKANNVIVCIGNGDSLDQSDNAVRTDCANALVTVLKKRKFRHVRVLIVSRLENSISNQNKNNKWLFRNNNTDRLRKQYQHVLKDHKGQEKAFQSISKRVTIVRPTTIRDDINKVIGAVQLLAPGEECSIGNKRIMSGFFSKSNNVDYTPRADLASWIVYETCSLIPLGGRIVNITGVRN